MEKNIGGYISSPDFHPLRLLPGESSGHHPRKPRKKRTNYKHIRNNNNNNNSGAVFHPKPARKPDPAAPKITRPCTECGRKFWSWKALFGHMRCHPERQWRGIVPPPNLRRVTAAANEDDDDGGGGASSAVTDEDHEVAACLLMLACGPPSDTCTVNQIGGAAADLCSDDDGGVMAAAADPGNCGRFECGSCKKVFGSHQALGGHRASHKNVKGCYAITRSADGEELDGGCCSLDFSHGGGPAAVMTNVGHKCSVCFRVFSSGQALGGHMRCHWEKATSSRVFAFDLNLAAREEYEDDDGASFACSSGVALDLRLGL